MTYKNYFLLSVFLLTGLSCFGQEQLNSINTTYEHIFLEEGRNDWNLGQLWYERKFSNLTSIFRIRYADRFNRSAYLSEIDLYPVFSEKSYGHVKVGASLSRKGLFPRFKASGTLFHNLSNSLVGGIGIRYQSFDIDDVILYSGTLNWYVKDYLFITQGFLQVRDKTPLGTAIFTARKYLKNPTYIFIKAAYGQSPQGLRFDDDAFETFSSYFISAGGNIELSSRFLLRTNVNYRESTFSSTTSRTRIGISTGLSYRF
jgi:YaiO family outer membrane protein